MFNNIHQVGKISSTDIAYGFINLISPNIYVVNIISALLGVTFFFLAMHNFAVPNYSLIILTIFVPFLIVSTGYTRQFVAVTAMAACWSCLVKKEKVIAGCIAAVGGVFHLSAVPVALGMSYRFFSPAVRKAMLLLFSVFFLIQMNKVQTMCSEYLLLSTGFASKGVFLRLLFLFPPICWLVIFARPNVKRDQLVLCHVALLLMVLAVPFSTLADRFSYYLIFMLPLGLHSVGAVKHYRLFIVSSIVISFLIFYIWYNYSFYAQHYWRHYSLWNPFTDMLLTF